MAYDAAISRPERRVDDTPNGVEGGIWMSVRTILHGPATSLSPRQRRLRRKYGGSDYATPPCASPWQLARSAATTSPRDQSQPQHQRPGHGHSAVMLLQRKPLPTSPGDDSKRPDHLFINRDNMVSSPRPQQLRAEFYWRASRTQQLRILQQPDVCGFAGEPCSLGFNPQTLFSTSPQSKSSNIMMQL